MPTSGASTELNDEDYERVNWLIQYLTDDLDSWLSSSIACCDSCYDDYVSKWPLAHTRKGGLQYQNMPAEAFYDGSRRVRGFLSETDFLRLLPYIACPNCGDSIGPNLFAFELPFDPADFEEDLRSLGDIARLAPFLVLTNSFAQAVKTEVEQLCSSIVADLPSGHTFRGRSVDAGSASATDFGPPPRSKTREGRYNHAGRPALYLAETSMTCWEECRRPHPPFSIATFVFTRPVKILDLSEPDEITEVMAALMYSNLAAAPSDGEGWDRPEYVLTRFVADCARIAGIDAIQYSSTRPGSGASLVLLDGSRFTDSVRITGIEIFPPRKGDYPRRRATA